MEKSRAAAITKLQAAIIAVIIVVAAVGAAYYLTLPTQPSPSTKRLVRRNTSVSGVLLDPAAALYEEPLNTLANVYDTLVHPALPSGVKPMLAKSWSVSTDGLTYTFNLNSGIKFHDGSEVKAEDVVFSMDRIIAMKQGFSFLFRPYVKDAIAVDNYTVQFELNKTYGPFLTALPRLFILNKDLVMANLKQPGSYGDYGDYGYNWLLTHDAGSGAYILKEIIFQEKIDIVQFKDYWQSFDPKAPEEMIYGLPNNDVAIKLAMYARDFEITDIWESQTELQILGSIPGVALCNYTWGCSWQFFMHTKKPPTDDIHFRKAIAWAIDYDKLVSLCPGATQAKGPVALDVPGADPNVFQYHRNLTKAMDELKQSKYYQYGNLTSAYPVYFDWFSGAEDEEKMALVVMSNLLDIGIRLVSEGLPALRITQDLSHADTAANMYIMAVIPNYPEAGSVMELRYHSSAEGGMMQGEWLSNATIDALIEEAQGTVNQTERFQKMAELQEIIVDMCPTIFVYDSPAWLAYQTYLDGPLVRGTAYHLIGYDYEWREWSVDLAKRDQLLGH